VKDGINDHVISGSPSVNPDLRGTKCAAHYQFRIGPGERRVVHLRLTRERGAALERTPEVFALRGSEAEESYATVVPTDLSVDADFAKEQLLLILREWYMHPNGQIPAYEWAFGDVNPPVLAWAAWRVYKIEMKRRGQGDRGFLKRVFHKLLLNFTWWVNRKDT